jgi:2-polyprenyl-6-methoxyphenol hydroxylase-like FAD-dependent oxidoreductase
MSASKPTEVDVAIVGGGIGGLATALAFKRLTNITARVYER